MTPSIVHRVHRMPFGAELRADGTTRFRLWAPAARAVELWIEQEPRARPMPRDAGGWAEFITRDAPAGTRYRYRIDRDALVPDPASRHQPMDVHGPSEVVDPIAYGWRDGAWGGVPAERLVFYELHVGAFTAAGTFAGVAERLDHLASLGVTAIELMPLAEFAGRRGWGYDGVLPYAPESSYGRPDELKALIDACHGRGLAVFLDVVYNHFGPEGNYLGRYAPAFASARHRTPWGAALNFDEPGSEVVRAFIVHNALYWIEEFHLDGLRVDATQSMIDDSPTPILEELARAVADGPGRERPVHLVVENDENDARLLARPEGGGRPLYQAQWNDDCHHAVHVLITGERDSYYADYDPPAAHLARCLTEGFAFQGEIAPHKNRPRGHPSVGLPPTAFVNFLQNHDHIGNRAFGERITDVAPAEAVRAATAVLLLAPALPMLFMGQEWAAPTPFQYFTDLGPDLGPVVSEGRRREFAKFAAFGTPDSRELIPDPQSPETRARSVLDWDRLARPLHQQWLAFHRALLSLREKAITPLLAGEPLPRTRWALAGATGLEVAWMFPAGARLTLAANLGAAPVPHSGPAPAWGRRLYALEVGAETWAALPPWSVVWYLAEGDA